MTMVRKPARASRSAAVDPAGPPPKTATVFIVLAGFLPAHRRLLDVPGGKA